MKPYWILAVLLPVTSIAAPVPQPNWLPGAYTVATLPPAAANRYYTAWVTDRPGSAGLMVSNGSSWASISVPSFSFGAHNTRTLAASTAYQATDPSRPAVVTINLTSTANLSLTGGTTNSASVVVGSTNAVAGGTGTSVCQYSNSSTGTLTLGINTNTIAASTCTIALPVGWYFAIRWTQGTGTITSAFDQSAGN